MVNACVAGTVDPWEACNLRVYQEICPLLVSHAFADLTENALGGVGRVCHYDNTDDAFIWRVCNHDNTVYLLFNQSSYCSSGGFVKKKLETTEKASPVCSLRSMRNKQQQNTSICLSLLLLNIRNSPQHIYNLVYPNSNVATVTAISGETIIKRRKSFDKTKDLYYALYFFSVPKHIKKYFQ